MTDLILSYSGTGTEIKTDGRFEQATEKERLVLTGFVSTYISIFNFNSGKNLYSREVLPVCMYVYVYILYIYIYINARAHTHTLSSCQLPRNT